MIQDWVFNSEGSVRALTPTEHFFNPPFGGASWPVSFAIRVSNYSENFAQQMRSSWAQLAIDYPHLTSYVKEYSQFVAQNIRTQVQLDEYLEHTFIIKKEVDDVKEFVKHLDPVAKSTLFWIPTCSTILLVCPHTTTDAIGALILLDHLFSNLYKTEQVQFREGQMTPSLELGLGIKETTVEEQKAAGEALMGYGMAQPTLCDEPVPNGNKELTNWATIEFSVAETQQIVDRSKALGVTVTAMQFAALITSIKGYEINQAAQNYTSFAVFNLRDKISPDAPSPLGFYGGFWPIVVNGEGTPSEVLAKTNKYLMRQKELVKDNCEGTRNAFLPVAEICIEQLRKQSDFAQMRHAPAISSVGKCDTYLKHHYNDLTVESFWECSPTYSPQVPILSWSFRGQLTMNACYNEAFYTPEYMQILEANLKKCILDF